VEGTAAITNQHKSESETNSNELTHLEITPIVVSANHRYPMSNFGHSGTSTFDDIVDANPLLFRLHSPTSSNTRFYAESKVLLSSRRAKALGCNDGPDILVSILKGLDEDPSSSTPFEPAAVARHITCWHDSNPGSSDFISLSFNVCFVLWDWKRRRSHQGQREDDFFIIVLKSSELRGIAKLGTEIVNKEEHYKAYNFTQAFDEIIVADIVRPAAILGTMPVSRLEGSIPSWWEKPLASMLSGPHFEEKMFRDFLRKLKVPANKSEDASTREILRFALALITPTMVRGKQRHANSDNGSSFYSAAIDRSTEEGKTPRVHHSDQDTMSEQIAAGKGYVPHR
jgi:hypothetical protein